MKPNLALQRSLASLSHPLSLVAIALLAANALVLQPNWPSWWTGKLGDLAWLAFVPLLVAVPLALTPFLSRRPPLVGWLAIGLTGTLFALVKVSPGVNQWVVGMLGGVGFSAKLMLDPTDLLALPGLAVAAWVWNHPSVTTTSRPKQIILIALAMLTVLADSAGPQDQGVICLAKDGDTLYATSVLNYFAYYNSNVYNSVYRSDDGGLTWTLEEVTASGNAPVTGPQATATPKPGSPPSSNCEKLIWPVYEAANTEIEYYGIGGKGIYRSEDDGVTLKLEAEFTSPVYGALIDEATHNVVVVAGRDGVWTRTPDGEWHNTVLKSETPK